MLELFETFADHVLWLHAFHKKSVDEHIVGDIELGNQRIIFALTFQHLPEFLNISVLIHHGDN